MKRIAFFTLSLALAVLLSGCGPSQSQPVSTASLRYDGIYCYISDFDSNGLINNYALRFYEDGTAIHTSVEQTGKSKTYFPSETWFNRESDYYTDLLGHYEFDDGSITLTTYSPKGSVDYQGTVQADKLVLRSHSNVTGYEISRSEYVFYSFEDLGS